MTILPVFFSKEQALQRLLGGIDLVDDCGKVGRIVTMNIFRHYRMSGNSGSNEQQDK